MAGMPMSEFFLPDVNFQTARGVYPTAPGGTVSSAAAAMTYNTGAIVPTGDPGHPIAQTVGVDAASSSSGAKSLGYWIGFLLFLVVLVWVSRKAGGAEDFRNIRPTLYNFLTITLTAIVGIVGLKVIFTRFRIPGASDIILAT
jgi:hypothetical protein